MTESFLSRLARRAMDAKALYLALTACCAILLLCIPIMYSFLRTRPCEMYERFLDADFSEMPHGLGSYLQLDEDAEGFVSSIRVIKEAELPGSVTLLVSDGQRAVDLPENVSLLSFSSDTVVFRHRTLLLEAPINTMPAWVLLEGDYREIVDRLALQNGYYGSFYLPVTMLVCFGCALSLVSLGGMLAGLLGLGRKMTHALGFGKRIRLLCALSWLCAIPCALLGFLMPVMHLILFAFAATILGWQVQKRI